MGELCDAEIRLDNVSTASGVVARTAAAMFVPPGREWSRCSRGARWRSWR